MAKKACEEYIIFNDVLRSTVQQVSARAFGKGIPSLINTVSAVPSSLARIIFEVWPQTVQ